MARPPHARERVLSAFETIVIAQGERAATLEATARGADVSKGGLLYHFPSRDALAEGLIARLEALVAEDLDHMSRAAEGPVSYFLRTSVMEDDPLDRAIIAVTRMAQGGSESAHRALGRMREQWTEALRPHVADDAALSLVLLLGDGLYFNNALGVNLDASTVPQGAALTSLITLVCGAVGNPQTEV